MTFSKRSIKDLLRTSVSHRKELERAYTLLPKTQCRRRTHCCSMLPEITLIEALAAIERSAKMTPSRQRHLVKNCIEYFFLNPVEITSCPFLEGQECIIYLDRFFGCRTYGLWSQGYYQELVAKARQEKLHLRESWENLGISLPEKVINYEVPYCTHVKIDGHSMTDDHILLNVSNRIEEVSGHLSPWHESFRRTYFSDLSFLIASLVYGVSDAVQMKFDIVYEIITKKERTVLNQAVKALPDLIMDLI